MTLDASKVRLKIENYFKSITKEQLHQDLLDAGLEIYSESPYKIEDIFVTSERKTIEETIDDNTFYEKLERQDIVRPTYFFKLETVVVSANTETNNQIIKQSPTTTSSLFLRGYHGDQSRIQKDVSERI
jgi:hypothetical protein